ncbi:hypothetical protein GCM10009714_21720 [Microlunatus capsulatus]
MHGAADAVGRASSGAARIGRAARAVNGERMVAVLRVGVVCPGTQEPQGRGLIHVPGGCRRPGRAVGQRTSTHSPALVTGATVLLPRKTTR